MAKSKACKFCKERVLVEEGVTVKMSFFCSIGCAAKHGIKLVNESKARQIERKKLNPKAKPCQSKAAKAERARMRQRRKEVKKPSEWYDKLQILVNQYVLHVLEAGAPCRTCGTRSQSIKYDAGHFRSRGSCPELRFELTNIHKQCSVKCNVHKSGARAEYNEFILSHYGQKHYDWLIGKHKPLKEQFPHWSDIEKEIIRYRKLLREHGLIPNV